MKVSEVTVIMLRGLLHHIHSESFFSSTPSEALHLGNGITFSTALFPLTIPRTKGQLIVLDHGEIRACTHYTIKFSELPTW